MVKELLIETYIYLLQTIERTASHFIYISRKCEMCSIPASWGFCLAIDQHGGQKVVKSRNASTIDTVVEQPAKRDKRPDFIIRFPLGDWYALDVVLRR